MKLIYITCTVFLAFMVVQGKCEEVTPSKDADVTPIRANKYGHYEECICFEIWEPVCANDGQTYANSCFLNCARRQQPSLLGVCEGECPCCKPPYQNEPLYDEHETGWGMPLISGAGDVPLMNSYGNHGGQPFKEEGDHQSVKEVTGADAKRDQSFDMSTANCICPYIYSPVCGSNNQTYGNSCEFQCAAKTNPCLTVACKGACPCCSCGGSVG